jgi:enoyl-CoA hydratase
MLFSAKENANIGAFDQGALACHPALEIKRVIRGITPDEAIASFARLWVADAHWQAAERVMNRTAGPRSAAGGAT